MKKLLDKLFTLQVGPKTGKEKLSHWFNNNENIYTFGGLFVIILSGLIFLPFLLTFFSVQNAPNANAKMFSYALCYCLSAMPAFIVWMILGTTLNSLANQNTAIYKQKFKDNILNYLRENLHQSEVKELILKIKLVMLYQEIKKDESISANFEKYTTRLEIDEINDFQINQAMLIIKKSNYEYFTLHQDLFEKSIEELKMIISKHLANELKKEINNAKKRSEYIHHFADNDENLFQNEKSLKASL
jgi:hypothetical protein